MAHAQRTRPAVVAFDVVGTLFSLAPIAARMREAELPEGRLTEWFARFLRDGLTSGWGLAGGDGVPAGDGRADGARSYAHGRRGRRPHPEGVSNPFRGEWR